MKYKVLPTFPPLGVKRSMKNGNDNDSSVRFVNSIMNYKWEDIQHGTMRIIKKNSRGQGVFTDK